MYRPHTSTEDETFLVNINQLPTTVEILDTDSVSVNGVFNTSALNIKNYANSQPSPVVDADVVLRANMSTGFGSYITALDLKNFINSIPSPVTNSNLVAVKRGGFIYKTTGLYLKNYVTGAVIDYLPVIVMAGQSNMEGDNADTSPLGAPYTGVLSNAKIYWKNTTSGTTNGAIQSLQNGVNQNWRSTNMGSNGPEIGVGYHTPILISHPIGIIKYSLGGSRLVDDGVTVSNAGLWDVNGSASRAGAFGLHYYILRDNFVKPALQKFIDAGYTPKLFAFSWCQGEADATIQYCADNYQPKLEQLFTTFKTDLVPYEPNVANINFIITRIHNNFNPGTRPYLTQVRTAQVNVGTTYLNAQWIDSDGYAVKADNIHWTRLAQASQHGQDVANRFATLYNP